MDKIADFLTIIRNAQLVRHKSIKCDYSKIKEKICGVLEKEGYIKSYSVNELTKVKKEINVELKYYKSKGTIEKIRRVSKCSRRLYFKADEIPNVRSGLGISIISTSQGIMTGKDAKKKNIGGEILCELW